MPNNNGIVIKHMKIIKLKLMMRYKEVNIKTKKNFNLMNKKF